MADYVNSTTLVLAKSKPVRAPWTAAPWVEITRAEHDTADVIPLKYREWHAPTQSVREMNASAKAAVDAAEIAARKASTVDPLEAGTVDDLLQAFALVVLDEINILRAQHSLPARTVAQLKAAVRGKLS